LDHCEVVAAPKLSVALLLKNNFQQAHSPTKLYGLVSASPNLSCSLENSTLAMCHRCRLQWPLIVTVDPVAKLALLVGLVILTVGGNISVAYNIAIVVEL